VSDPNLYAFLKGVQGVVDLVADRIFKQQVPQHDPDDLSFYPCAVFQRSGGDRTRTFCAPDSLVPGSFRILCMSPHPDEPETLENAIRAALRNYRGRMGDVTVWQVDESANTDEGPDPEPGIYVRAMTLNIWYRET
jgi:hypothetical protein